MNGKRRAFVKAALHRTAALADTSDTAVVPAAFGAAPALVVADFHTAGHVGYLKLRVRKSPLMKKPS